MPLTSEIHVFASHKGGTGKTQLCFQAACQYAKEHPAENVLLMDLTELGDLSKRALGGTAQDPRVIEENCGRIFDLIHSAEQQNSVEERNAQSGLYSFWNYLRNPNSVSLVDIPSIAVKPRRFNAAIPENVFLISSGAASGEENARTTEQTIQLANALREGLSKTPGAEWKLFIDTDGDRRPSAGTRLGYALGDLCIVPLQPDESDFGRIVPMFEVMRELWRLGEMRCKIQMIVWNKLQLYKSAPGPLGSFQTPKVTTEMIQSLNKKLFEYAKSDRFNQIFQHTDAPTVDVFRQAATCLVRDFPDTCSIVANAKGIPYFEMTPGKVKLASGAEFSVQQPQIDSCVENVKEVVARLDRMEIDEDGL